MPVTYKIKIKNKQGIHMKPATAIARIALENPETIIHIEKDGQKVLANSIMSILGLEVIFENEITFHLDGDDAEVCKEKIDELIQQNLL